MKECHPDVIINIEVDSSRPLVQRLLQGDLDMVVGRVLDSEGADDLVYEPLAADEPHAIIAGAQHPLAGRDDLQLEDLIDQPWILPPAGSLVRDKIAAKFVELGLPLPNNIIETASIPLITTLLQQSNMLVALPQDSVQSFYDARVLTVLVENLPLGVGAFGLITRRNRNLSRAAQLTLSTLRELSGKLYAADGRGFARSRPSRCEASPLRAGQPAAAIVSAGAPTMSTPTL
jgi:DNA-binding transcriptional LysR family regulator